MYEWIMTETVNVRTMETDGTSALFTTSDGKKAVVVRVSGINTRHYKRVMLNEALYEIGDAFEPLVENIIEASEVGGLIAFVNQSWDGKHPLVFELIHPAPPEHKFHESLVANRNIGKYDDRGYLTTPSYWCEVCEKWFPKNDTDHPEAESAV